MNRWVAGARPRTLPAALVPVLVGTATAVGAVSGGIIWWRAGAALVVAVAIQVGTNYANDYHDGIRGTDDARVGPVRLVAAGLATPKSVKTAAVLAFVIAGGAGGALAAATTWWLLLVGAVSFAAGWLYTGGPRPYGYHGLGEVFVFLFFGVVATVGSAFVQLETVTLLAVSAAVPVGLLATALLVTNNLRDIPGDTAAGKRTLAVRLGDSRTRALYVAVVLAVFVAIFAVVPLRAGAGLGLLAAPLAWAPVRQVRAGVGGLALVPVLEATGRLQLATGALLAIGLVVSA